MVVVAWIVGCRAEGDVGLEGGVGRVFFGSDVDGPVSCVVVLAAARHDGVGRVSAGFESEGVDFGLGEKIGKSKLVGKGETEGVAFVEGRRGAAASAAVSCLRGQHSAAVGCGSCSSKTKRAHEADERWVMRISRV